MALDPWLVLSAWNIDQDLPPERVWEASYQILARAFLSRRNPDLAGIGRVMEEDSGRSRKMHRPIPLKGTHDPYRLRQAT